MITESRSPPINDDYKVFVVRRLEKQVVASEFIDFRLGILRDGACPYKEVRFPHARYPDASARRILIVTVAML